MGKRGVKLDGEKLVECYQRRGWSQQDLARKSGLDARTITKVKNGGVCDASTHQCLAKALDVPPEELLFHPAAPLIEVGEQVVAAAPREPAAPGWNHFFRIEKVWKIIDLRQPRLKPRQPLGGTVWDYYRVCKLDDEQHHIVFPYLTWGDGIDCLAKPEGSVWEKRSVRPGDLVHSEKQWELKIPAPPGPLGTMFECSPIQLRFVNAFHGENQQWWQVRVAYPIYTLILQVMFSPDLPCRHIEGASALLGQMHFEPLHDNPPYLLPDGTLASWRIENPQVGAFYKLAWQW